ncbi:STAS domain-containing protein [Ramlibacter sp. G-1-2-2]|uniref:STAS domain-containing protein n=1 Tax=Ramlibacter agri TaxID=2728837 RepID=A0A848HGA1_9BURK|nr:STAS domain-containing protein [Ramlibacter agri]
MSTPVTVLAVEGELSIYRAADLCAEWREAIAPDTALVLDLAEVSECDTAGVQLLLAAARRLEQGGGSLQLRAPSAPVCDALATLGLQARFAHEGEPA